jgi:hypothetical protein
MRNCKSGADQRVKFSLALSLHHAEQTWPIPLLLFLVYQVMAAVRLPASSVVGKPCRVLGEITSTFAVVRLAFVKLALEHHPDKDSGSNENFFVIRKPLEEIPTRSGSKWNADGLVE